MAMQTVYFKEHQGIVNNSIGLQSGPWWGAFSSQSVYGESLGPFKSAQHSTDHDKGKNTTQFTIFHGDCKNSMEGQKPQLAFSVESAPPEHHARFELGLGQPMICANFSHAGQCYGLFSAYVSQAPGRVMLPLNLLTDDGPIYVNAKQYHGIIRRRQSRAKAEMENKIARLRKPYMHESRHCHAMRRPRGCGGRFLNKKAVSNRKGEGTEAKKVADGLFSQTSGSQSSEVLQSDSGTMNSSKEANGTGSNHPGSEVTSMYSRRDMTQFRGHEIIVPRKWVV